MSTSWLSVLCIIVFLTFPAPAENSWFSRDSLPALNFTGTMLNGRFNVSEKWSIDIKDTVAAFTALQHYYAAQSVTNTQMQALAHTLNTPEKISAYTLGFIYKDFLGTHADDGTTYAPMESVQRGVGLLCRDQQTFITYMLRANGYNAHTVNYTSANRYHSVTMFQDKADGLWKMIEYGTIHDLSAENFESALNRGLPDAFKYWLYNNPTDPSHQPTEVRQIWTRQAYEINQFMIGDVGYDDSIVQSDIVDILRDAIIDLRNLTHYKSLLELRLLRGLGSNNKGSIGTSVGSRQVDIAGNLGCATLQVRHHYNSDISQLTQGTLGTLRLHLRHNMIGSAGIVLLPQAYNLSIARRDFTAAPIYFSFLSARWNPTLWYTPLFTKQMMYHSRFEGWACMAFPLLKSSFKSTAVGFSDANIRFINSVQYRHGPICWIDGSLIGELPLGLLAHYTLSRGPITSSLPFAATWEMRMHFTPNAQNGYTATISLPLNPAPTNLTPNEPSLSLRGFRQWNDQWSSVLHAQGRLFALSIDQIRLATSYRQITAQIVLDALNDPYVQPSIQLGFTANGFF